MYDSLQHHVLQHASLPWPSRYSGVCSDSCPLSQWRYLTISSSAALFSFCPQSLLASDGSLLCFLHCRRILYPRAVREATRMKRSWEFLGRNVFLGRGGRRNFVVFPLFLKRKKNVFWLLFLFLNCFGKVLRWTRLAGILVQRVRGAQKRNTLHLFIYRGACI